MIKKIDTVIARQIGKLPGNLKGIFRAVSSLGSIPTVAAIGAVTAYLLWSGVTGAPDIDNVNFQYSGGLMLLFLPLGFIIKALTRRQRPDTIYVEQMRFKHFSFPSGHAYGSLLVYGFLAFLAASWPAYILTGILVLLIGFARVYLGAHFPSDVIGGWLLAAVVLAVVINYANHIVL